MLFYYNASSKDTPLKMSLQLTKFIMPQLGSNQPVILLCVGSDRSTGDSLGPLVGYKLQNLGISNVTIYGTLYHPVHATNLEETIDEIYDLYEDPFIIAIDASLGKEDHIGCITIGTGALKPGIGVKKNLPEVGNIHITGIVNISGETDILLLQTTRLSTIMTLADVIIEALLPVLHQLSPIVA